MAASLYRFAEIAACWAIDESEHSEGTGPRCAGLLRHLS